MWEEFGFYEEATTVPKETTAVETAIPETTTTSETMITYTAKATSAGRTPLRHHNGFDDSSLSPTSVADFEDIIVELELGDRPHLTQNLTEIDRYEKDRPRTLKTAQKYNESLSRFIWASSKPLAPTAYGKFLRTRDDTSALYICPPVDIQSLDILLNDRFVYRTHIKPSKLLTKPWTKPARREQAHGRPPEPDLSELCISDHHDTSATSSRVLKGSEPETTNVDTDRIPF